MSTGPLPNQVNIYQDTPNQVVVDQDAENRIIVSSVSGSGNTRRHVHEQATPASTWTITHTLGGKPSVTVVDSANTVVIGEVTYIGNTQVELSFTTPFSGFAYLT